MASSSEYTTVVKVSPVYTGLGRFSRYPRINMTFLDILSSNSLDYMWPDNESSPAGEEEVAHHGAVPKRTHSVSPKQDHNVFF